MLLLVRGTWPRCVQSRLPAACSKRIVLPTPVRCLHQAGGEAGSQPRSSAATTEHPTPPSPVLRFAPSPTGQLHLGGLRTALFNHLYARSKGGKWILRIEDTDQKRYVPGAVEAMQDILRWSGLEYDEGPDKPGSRGPYVQSERLHLYKAYADRLLDSGHAYRDFRAAEEKVDEGADGQERGKEDRKGSKIVNVKLWQRYVPPSEEAAQRLIAEGRPYVIRLRSRSAESKTYEFKDVVYGTLHLSTDSLGEDPILVKSDGWPTYHLANVVDDLEMGITHVFRGEEWIPSMPTHLALYEALGKAPPHFVHLPLLVNADGSKLSKRVNDVHVESFRSQNYEPEALINFVALLGHNWQHATQAKLADVNREKKSKADRSIFTMEELVAGFSLDEVSKSRACPDITKLQSLNRHHLARKLGAFDPQGKVKLVNDLMEALEQTTPRLKFVGGLEDHQVEQIGVTFLSRSHDIKSAYDAVVHLFSDVDLDSDETKAYWASLNAKYSEIAWKSAIEAVQGVNKRDYKTPRHGKAVMARILTLFQVAMKKLAKTEHVPQFGRPQLFHPLRLALTGRKGGPPLQDILVILGKTRTLERLALAARHFEGQRSNKAGDENKGDDKTGSEEERIEKEHTTTA